MTPTLGPRTLLATAATCAIGLAAVATWSERQPHPGSPAPPFIAAPQVASASTRCSAGELKGAQRIGPSGEQEYFDGQCWTTTPMPPRDTPNLTPYFHRMPQK